MDPEKRFTCAQLLQHPYFDGFSNEFEREKKEQQKHLHREQQKLIQQQPKLQNSVYSQSKQQAQGKILPSLTGITGTQFASVHGPQDFLSQTRPSRLEIYLDHDPRLNIKPRFGQTNTNDSDNMKPSPQSNNHKRLAYGDNFTHFPNI
ncbi:unnamed protein product [Didymodactylos carnosus]|uniref:Uncharacterized protein n=2 Tax=Didymodactylos carnosus TaxID=1234261 RepID=A0A814D2R9_9BILA|nr:unnamed protein product [Didymodactylos carnosus]CAF3724033.1 unnamed protein product [Didymodactylos carnosus]